MYYGFSMVLGWCQCYFLLLECHLLSKFVVLQIKEPHCSGLDTTSDKSKRRGSDIVCELRLAGVKNISAKTGASSRSVPSKCAKAEIFYQERYTVDYAILEWEIWTESTTNAPHNKQIHEARKF